MVKVPQKHEPSLRAIADMSQETLDLLVRSIRIAPAFLRPTRLSAWVGEDLKDRVPDAEQIVEMLIGMTAARVQASVSVTAMEFAKAVAQTLRAEKTLDEAQCNALEKALVSLLSIRNPLELTVKAFRIQANHPQVFRSAQILTDIRPVFASEEPEVLGAVEVHNLRIDFYEASNTKDAKSFFVALDRVDLAKLQKVIERALEKQKTILDFVAASRVSMPRGEGDG